MIDPSPALGPGHLVVFTPLPPLENGIADYSAELLPELARARDVTVVVDDHAPSSAAFGCTVITLAQYESREYEFRDAPHIYQLGNNRDHAYMLAWVIRRPGIVVLHDVSLHHLMDQATLRWGDVDGYGEVLALEYGKPGKLLFEQFRRHGIRTRSMFYELPLTRELVGRARAVVVHSLFAASKVAAQQPATPVVMVPHHVAPRALAAAEAIDRDTARASLGVDASSLLLVSLGFVTRAKQVDVVLRFLAKHRHAIGPFRYIIAGQDHPDDFDVRALAVSLGLDDVVTVTGYIGEDAFFRHVIAADIVVNLRYPSGGETSGTLIRSLGMGACVVINDIGPFAEYPSDVCVKVPVVEGRHGERFEAAMLQLIGAPELRRRCGVRAKAYMARTHTLARSMRLYLQAVSDHGNRPVLPLSTTSHAAFLTPADIEARLDRLDVAMRRHLPVWASEAAVPIGGSDTGRVLVLGNDVQEAAALLCCIFGYAPGDIDLLGEDAMFSSTLQAPRTHRLIICQWSAQVFDRVWTDATASILNRCLEIGGHLILNLVAAGAGTGTRQAAVSQLEAAGFEVEYALVGRAELSFALDGGLAGSDKDSQPPGVLVRGRKFSDFTIGRAGGQRGAS